MPSTDTKRSLMLLLATAGALSAQVNLQSKSPFLPPNHGVVAAKPLAPAPSGTIARQLEFRGVIQIGDEFHFSIFNKKENLGYWLKEGENANGVVVNDFDTGNLSLTVSKDGRSERLAMASANERPLPIKNTGPVVSRTPGSMPQIGKQAKPLPAILQTQATLAAPVRPGNVVRRRVVLPKK